MSEHRLRLSASAVCSFWCCRLQYSSSALTAPAPAIHNLWAVLAFQLILGLNRCFYFSIEVRIENNTTMDIFILSIYLIWVRSFSISLLLQLTPVKPSINTAGEGLGFI